MEGVTVGVIGWVLYRKKRALVADWQKSWGEVIEVKERHGAEGGATKHPVIRYTTLQGEVATFESNYGSSSWRVKVGDRLEILVSQTAPGQAEVVGLMSQWGLPLIFGVVAVGSLISAPLVYLLL
jgi:hypothetical protein